MEVRACSTVRISVTHTCCPAERRASTSSARFSSALAMTRSGARLIIDATSGFFVPPTRTASRSIGWLHQSVTPARVSGALAAIASVSEGTRLTIRRGAVASRTWAPVSSTWIVMPPECHRPSEPRHRRARHIRRGIMNDKAAYRGWSGRGSQCRCRCCLSRDEVPDRVRRHRAHPRLRSLVPHRPGGSEGRGDLAHRGLHQVRITGYLLRYR